MRPMYSLGQSTLAPVPKGVTFLMRQPSTSSVNVSLSLDSSSFRGIQMSPDIYYRNVGRYYIYLTIS